MKILCLIPLSLLLLLLPLSHSCGRERWSDNALQYNAFNRSKIHLSPMVTLVEDHFTLCSWVNKMLPGKDNFWAFYGTESYPVFHISDDLKKVGVFNSSIVLSTTPDITLNQWYHTCLSWNGDSGESSLYLNGVLIGTGQTSDGVKVPDDSELFLNWCPYSDGVFFGGELFKLQFYKEVLKVEQVERLHHQGICSDVDQLYTDIMTLPWEYFILHEKYRFNVQLVPVKCQSEHSAWNVLYSESYLGNVISTKMVQDLKKRWELLEEFAGHLIDESLIEHLIHHHDI